MVHNLSKQFENNKNQRGALTISQISHQSSFN
jgi:hypothetical protein